MGFTTMTLVQKLSMPHVLGGHDVLIRSQTGSGKLQKIIPSLLTLFKDKFISAVLSSCL